ncbi:MAG: hypothetical protein JNJ45_00635 [Chthonomonas sp.]|nr:hypothetical protein [Chthonomonas sp.]
MLIYEPHSYLDVETPLGRGNVWLVKDYGLEMDTFYTVIIREGDHAGQIFDFSNSDVRVTANYTLHRGKWRDLAEKIRKAESK